MHNSAKLSPQLLASYNASRKAYEASIANPSTKSQFSAADNMLEVHGELISKERFAEIFDKAWAERLGQIKGKRQDAN
jgi:hypothetical protein